LRVRNLFLGAVFISSVAFAAPCDPANPSNNLCLIGVGNNIVLDGVYISPYTAIINGVTTSVICDDFSDEVMVPESWTVTSGIGGSTTQGLFGQENTAGYAKVAWLSQQLFTQPLSNSGVISYAIWAVFDQTNVQNWLNAYNDTTTYNAVFSSGGLLDQAASHSGDDFSYATFYTPVDGTQSCCGRPQEFVVVNTPEPSAASVLGVDLLGFGALAFLFRRRLLEGR
jgi:hypothetical protein